jgi:hypothetical protein
MRISVDLPDQQRKISMGAMEIQKHAVRPLIEARERAPRGARDPSRIRLDG